jgi:hypothetical protein
MHYVRGSQPGGRVPLGGRERSQISDTLGTFVSVSVKKVGNPRTMYI